jgi:hypothetical protein
VSAGLTVKRTSIALLLIGLALVCSWAFAEPVFAAECSLCHYPGGIAPDGSEHPVTPRPLWDPVDGQCTICHEWTEDPAYQPAPHGAYWIDSSGGWRDRGVFQHVEITEGSNCRDCHQGDVAHGATMIFNGGPLPGPIDISGSDCAGCHTSGMSFLTDPIAPAYTAQIDPNTHGDTSAHNNIAEEDCTPCHGASVTDIHATCDTCHPPFAELAGYTCTTCHDDLSPAHAGPIVGKVWTYQDASDPHPKTEGGYNTECATCHGDFTGEIISPHGGYDTSTNKCKVCYAVHRAEGTYYLLRATSQDDACDYCHIGESAHGVIVYTGNDAGKYTPNGHTIGASPRIPDSTVNMTSTVVTLQGTPVKVRTYVDEKKQMYRVQWWGRSPVGHPAYGDTNPLTFGKIGPTPLSCSSCHQVHNAQAQIWQPPAYAGGYNDPTENRMTEGYKLLRRFPGATTLVAAGEQAGTTVIAKVPESTLIADVNYSTNASMETTYVDIDAAGRGDGGEWRQPDWVVGSQFYSYHANVTQYTLSVWCADCHNLNIGARGVETGDSELGFSKAHAERTHPVPASRGFQCYSCHRSGLGANSPGGCNRCHYNNQNYPIDAAASVNEFGRPSDFPHAGADDEIKLLGAFSVDSAPVLGGGQSTFSLNYVETAITSDNLDAVCLRCHTDQGVHQ